MEAAEKQGRVRPLDEETELAMYTEAMDLLETAGFEHYELSNFARLSVGGRCRHNQVYWANHAHFGFGVGADPPRQGVRELTPATWPDYIRKVKPANRPRSNRNACRRTNGPWKRW